MVRLTRISRRIRTRSCLFSMALLRISFTATCNETNWNVKMSQNLPIIFSLGNIFRIQSPVEHCSGFRICDPSFHLLVMYIWVTDTNSFGSQMLQLFFSFRLALTMDSIFLAIFRPMVIFWVRLARQVQNILEHYRTNDIFRANLIRNLLGLSNKSEYFWIKTVD